MIGRKPKPEQILALTKGKLYDVQRDRVENTPRPVNDLTPRCPKHFDKEQKKRWRYFCVILKNYNLFEIANAPLLEVLVVNWVYWQQELEKSEPDFNKIFKLQDRVVKCLGELGLSSVGMAKLGSLSASTKKKKSEMEALID